MTDPSAPSGKRAKNKLPIILDAATRVFASKGYHGSTIADVAGEAGVAAGTIYLYVKRKEDLLVSLFQNRMGSHLDESESFLRSLAPGAEQLAGLVTSHLTFYQRNEQLARVFQLHTREPHPRHPRGHPAAHAPLLRRHRGAPPGRGARRCARSESRRARRPHRALRRSRRHGHGVGSRRSTVFALESTGFADHHAGTCDRRHATGRRAGSRHSVERMIPVNDALHIRQAAVLGAGVMGAAIAAHLANAGIPTLLLDMKTEGDARAADKLAAEGLKRATRAKPASFFTRGAASLVTVGNFDDDVAKLAAADWVVEAIVENLDIKRSLYERIAPHIGPDAVISSNTSGLSVNALSAALPAALRPRFLVTHFFNPPRYLKLLELVPGPDTNPTLITAMQRFGEDRLGKGVVFAKDTPNFIGNRIGVFSLMHGVRNMQAFNLTVSDVDAITGPLIGRPKSATFRTADVVGLDTLLYVSDGMADRLPDDPERENLRPPDFVRALVESKRLGEKTQAGFYKKTMVDGKRAILMLNPETDDYVPTNKPAFASLAAAMNEPTAAERVRTVLAGKDDAAEFLWSNLSATMRYAASCVPEISDDIAAVDDAMRWGFGWELGPFELWDAIGVADAAARMEADGHDVPALVRRVLDTPPGRFYGDTTAFDPVGGSHVERPADPRRLTVRSRHAHIVSETDAAALVDMGDDVFALEFRTKMNTIDPRTLEAMNAALDHVEEHGRGLVIGNDDNDFCAGANLKLMLDGIERDDFTFVEKVLRKFQSVNQRLRFSSRPTVVATRGLTLGGGLRGHDGCRSRRRRGRDLHRLGRARGGPHSRRGRLQGAGQAGGRANPHRRPTRSLPLRPMDLRDGGHGAGGHERRRSGGAGFPPRHRQARHERRSPHPPCQERGARLGSCGLSPPPTPDRHPRARSTRTRHSRVRDLQHGPRRIRFPVRPGTRSRAGVDLHRRGSHRPGPGVGGVSPRARGAGVHASLPRRAHAGSDGPHSENRQTAPKLGDIIWLPNEIPSSSPPSEPRWERRRGARSAKPAPTTSALT